MFTFKEWEAFCHWISEAGINCITAQEAFFSGSLPAKSILLKHDVEADTARALAIARIENRFSLKGTFYIQAELLANSENIEKFTEMAALGHEIAYHYDVLDSCNGDWEAAIDLFRSHVFLFRKHGFDIRTVCPHGNPIKKRSGWDSNKDFFRSPQIRGVFPNIIDLVFSFAELGHGCLYFSDAGFKWRQIGDISNNDRHPAPDKNSSLRQIRSLLGHGCSMVVSIHPHRWCRFAIFAKSRKLFFAGLKFFAQKLEKNDILKSLLSRFFFLARKF